MTTVDPVQQNKQEISRLQNEINNLHRDVRLASLRDQVEDLATTIGGFPQRVQNLRARKYAFEKNLEANAGSFTRRWMTLKSSVANEINRQAASLETALIPTESKMTRLAALQNSPAPAKTLIAQVDAEVKNLKSKTSAAQQAIQGMYNAFQNEVNQFKQKLERIEKMLTNLEEASFALMPNEAGIIAVEATLVDGKEDKDDPKGILFLTDQRLIFEQKQDVAKKKVLFIATEKERVQQMLMDIPLGMVEEIKPSKRGVFKNEDHIDFAFQSGAPMREAHLHLFGQDCAEWQSTIQRAKSGEYDQDRAIAMDEKAAQDVRDVPTVCPGCGASLQQKVLRGMDSITCPYCGKVIRI